MSEGAVTPPPQTPPPQGTAEPLAKSDMVHFESCLECLTCTPLVGIVQRDDEKFWERCVFETFMRSLSYTREMKKATESKEKDKKDEDEGNSMDDMAFFVRKQDPSGTKKKGLFGKKSGAKKDEFSAFVADADEYFVRRRNEKTDVLLTREEKLGIDWQESYVLNMVMQCFVFRLTVHICRVTPQGKFAPIRSSSTRVYPSTVKVNVDSFTKHEEKGATEVSYPTLFFAMYDFDDVFKDVIVAPDLAVCVDLSVLTPSSSLFGLPLTGLAPEHSRISVFCGAIRYAKLKSTYATSGNSLLAHTIFAKIPRAFEKPHQPKYIDIKGPNKIGNVQFCFNKMDPDFPIPDEYLQYLDKEKVEKRTEDDPLFQCMPFHLSLGIHEIIKAIITTARSSFDKRQTTPSLDSDFPEGDE